MKTKSSDIFMEQYEVSIDIQQDNGTWTHNRKVNIPIPVKHGENEKGNHYLALREVERLFPGCRVNRITYA